MMIGLSERIGGGIEELNKVVRSQLGHNSIGVFLGNVDFVVLHLSRAKDRHQLFSILIISKIHSSVNNILSMILA